MSNWKNKLQSNRRRMAHILFSLVLSVLCLHCYAQDCPNDDPTLIPWAPGNQPDLDVVIDGESFLLTESATLRTIDITNGGRLVIDDYRNSTKITLRVRQIEIQRGGGFHVGSEACPYIGYLDIVLYGMIGDGDEGVPAFGRKFIGVAPQGTLEMHGQPRVAWTYLNSTLFAGQGFPDNITIIDLADNVLSWQLDYPDIVIGSSDYDPEHTEVFQTVVCNPCTQHQIRILGMPQYTHFGSIVDGVDMRAEVGVLSRNVRIIGEVEDQCYGLPDLCPFFDRDLFGGQTQVLVGFTAAHFSDIELINMGQQALGNYPIHFHRSGLAYGAYARRLSIHHTSSRCVTIHASEGVLVEDVVGYDSIGHCFFLEDGNEINNTLRHNLGLLTRAGALLPHDRNAASCAALLDAVEPGYNPDVDKECRAASTFWITHPDNIVVDNAAGGSEEFGFFYVFHREPTGPSSGTLPPYHGERSPLAVFRNNRAHSNRRGGLSFDRGLKTTDASPEDPREFLALIENGRFSPHENRDLYAPRVPAIIDGFLSYKNFRGAEIRGGDVIVQDSTFVDDTIGLTFLSENTLPYDLGSHQEVTRSRFIGQSVNFRPSENYVHSYPQRGIEFRDGPVVSEDCTFTEYIADEYRATSSAFSFFPDHDGQFSTKSLVRGAVFTDQSLRLWLGSVGGVYGDYNSDGDQTQVLFDEDGSLSGDAQAYLVRTDKDILSAGCRPEPTFGASVCTGVNFGQVFVYQLATELLSLTVEDRDGTTVSPYVFGGVMDDDDYLRIKYNYQPVLASGRDYNLHWDAVAPASVIIAPHNFNVGESVGLALCYPSETTFVVEYQEYDQLTDNVTYTEAMTQGASVDDVNNDPRGRTYFWDEAARFLYLKSVQEFPLDGYNYCSASGCQGIFIGANIINQEISDCRATRN